MTSVAVAEIHVNPAVLEWARKSRRLSLDRAASLLEIPRAELEDYERTPPRRHPTISILQKMSAKYQINYAALFMPQPLDLGTPPLKDFRSGKDFEAEPLSLNTCIALQDIVDTLETFADLRIDAPGLFAVHPLDSVARGETADALAIRQRSKIGVPIRIQRDWPSDATAREQWRATVERRGVFVYFMPLGAECSGFTVRHEGLFAICINDEETNNGRRIFTLFHEYCHVLRRQTGISDENLANPVERFCSTFAAAFLVPFSALVTVLGEPTNRRDFSPRDVGRLARKFWVSWSAMALRLEHAGYANRGLYDQIAGIVRKPRPPRVRDREDIKVNRTREQARRLGARHTMITLEALKRGVINTADARDLLGVEPAQFSTLRAAVE